MTGFRRSRRSSDKRNHGMLTCRIVVATPVRSKNDNSSPRRHLTRPRSRSWRGKPITDIQPFAPAGSCDQIVALPSMGPCEALMCFSIRPYPRFRVQCSVTNNAGSFQGQARSGISHVLTGCSPVICRCDRGKPSRSRSRSRMSNALKRPQPWCGGQGGRSLRSRISQ